jgi:hypothetical protein
MRGWVPMRKIAQLIYFLNRVLLLALSLGFLSFYLVSNPSLSEKVKPIVEAATQYLPILLVPVVIAMLIVLVLRYAVKNESETIGFGDVLAGLLALAGQIGVIALYRAQGAEVVNSGFLSNIPNVTAIAAKGASFGILGVAALQFLTFILYWIADPNKKHV